MVITMVLHNAYGADIWELFNIKIFDIPKLSQW